MGEAFDAASVVVVVVAACAVGVVELLQASGRAVAQFGAAVGATEAHEAVEAVGLGDGGACRVAELQAVADFVVGPLTVLAVSVVFGDQATLAVALATDVVRAVAFALLAEPGRLAVAVEFIDFPRHLVVGGGGAVAALDEATQAVALHVDLLTAAVGVPGEFAFGVVRSAELDAQCIQRLRDITRLDIAALRR